MAAHLPVLAPLASLDALYAADTTALAAAVLEAGFRDLLADHAVPAIDFRALVKTVAERIPGVKVGWAAGFSDPPAAYVKQMVIEGVLGLELALMVARWGEGDDTTGPHVFLLRRGRAALESADTLAAVSAASR